MRIPPGFECVTMLGRGSFAEVWHVRRAGRDYACKIIDHRCGEPPRAAQEEPANLRRCCTHPGVVTLHRAWTAETIGLTYVLTDLCPGGTAELLTELLPATVRGVAAALQHCHSAGVVHADVKPGNVCFAADGRPVLIDFGLSVRLPLTGPRRGTPLYVAPEVVRRDPWTPASDVWSLGVTMFEVATRTLPWDGARGNEDLFDRIESEEAPLDRLDDPQLRDLIARMLEKDPGLRATLAQVMDHPWTAAGPAP